MSSGYYKAYGPYRVVKFHDSVVTITLNNIEKQIHMRSCKPAYLLSTDTEQAKSLRHVPSFRFETSTDFGSDNNVKITKNTQKVFYHHERGFAFYYY